MAFLGIRAMSKTFIRSVRKWSAVAVLAITAATSVLASVLRDPAVSALGD
jgi:hypothetical protein